MNLIGHSVHNSSVENSFELGVKQMMTAERSPIVLFLLIGGVLLGFIGMIIMSVTVHKLLTRFPYPNDCYTRDCLWEASELKNDMNVTADPCNDFYNYACGNFPNNHPLDSISDRMTVSSILAQKNEASLKAMLEEPPKMGQSSYEWKMKTFFQSCIDDYKRVANGAKPLIQDIKKLGGWFAFPGQFQLTDWKKASTISNALINIHTLYGANPFLTVSVRGDWDSRKPGMAPDTNTIQITPTTLDMGSASLYLSTSKYAQNIRKFYTGLIKDFINLMWKEGNWVGDLDSYTSTVISDVMFVETTLANISITSPVIYDPSQEHKTIQFLQSNYGSVIDWYHFLSTFFQGAPIQQTTEVHVQHLKYVESIATFIGNLLKSDNGTRQLNNYMMWKLAYFYRSELGWDYVHASRIWSYVKYGGYVKFVGQYNWCYIQLDRWLPHGLSALFISRKFKHESFAKVQTAYNYFKEGFIQRIDSPDMSWITEADRQTAKNKINAQKDFIGYDIQYEDQTYMDNFYSKLVIQKDLHFANFRQIQQWHRQYMTSQLGNIKIDQWPAKLYQASAYHDTSTNTNFFPAGMLQHPIFDSRIPMFANFAGMGVYMADLFHQSINYPGRYYDASGKNVHGSDQKGWWSQSTYDKYINSVIPCHGHMYDNATICYTPFIIGFMNSYDASQLAVQPFCVAYDDFLISTAPEQSLPGFQHENIDQTFFLAFAQKYCFNESPINTYIRWKYYYNSPNNILLNNMLGELPKFQKAFNCPANSTMVKTHNCPGF